jgi:hypothetical protein
MHECLITANEALGHSCPARSRYFRQRFNVANKADLSPVTVVDQTTGTLMRGVISNRHPEHGIEKYELINIVQFSHSFMLRIKAIRKTQLLKVFPCHEEILNRYFVSPSFTPTR